MPVHDWGEPLGVTAPQRGHANFANFTSTDLSGADLIGMGSYFATFRSTRCDGRTQLVNPPLNCVNGQIVSQ